MIYKDLPCIVKNSQNVIYKFWLDSFNNLNVENYNQSNVENNIKFIYKQSVQDYSVDIDDMDLIHIIFVTKDGVIKYSTLHSPDLEKTINRVPSKDYKIDYLTIKKISSDIHIFYMIQNKYNVDKWTINHSFFHNNVWNSKKLDETLFLKNSIPYSIDVYKNNIYIFYALNTSNQYCIQKFNISFSMWSTIENDITLINCRNSELFVNNLGIGVICYNSYINKNANTLLKFKDFNINSSIWSDEVLVRNNVFDFSLPSVLCKNDALFLFWKENDTLFLRKSSYETNNLSEKSLIPYTDMLYSCKYITSSNLQLANKSNFLFFINTTPPYTILEDNTVKYLLKVDYSKIEQKFNPLNGPLRETLKIIAQNIDLNNKPFSANEENYSNERTVKTETLELDTDKLTYHKKEPIDLELLINDISSKDSEIEQLKNNLGLKEGEIEQLKNNLTLKDNDIQQFKNSLSLKENEIQSLNASYYSAKSIEGEKDLLIQSLSNKVEELEHELQSKKELIENSQIQKKKRFIDLFKI